MSKGLDFLGDFPTDRYQLPKEHHTPLGKGATAWVTAYEDKKTGELVAVKTLNLRSMDTNSQQFNYLKSELQILAKLIAEWDENDDAALARPLGIYHDTRDNNSYIRIIFEKMDQNLGAIIRDIKNGAADALSLHEIKVILFMVLKALESLHQKKIIHHDVKPENVLLKTDEDSGQMMLRLTDFGCSVIDSNDDDKNTSCLSPSYVSPEHLCHQTGETFSGKACPYPLTTKSDMWSTGILMYELITGRTPLKDAGMLEQAIALEDPEKSYGIKKLAKDLDRLVEGTDNPVEAEEHLELVTNLLGSFLQADPKDRPTAAEALLDPFFETDF